MGAGYVIVSVLVALFAVWGALMMWRSIFEWLFAPVQVRGAVFIQDRSDIENLCFLLTEAQKSCMCRKGSALIVILPSQLVSAWEQAEESAWLSDDMPPSLVLESFGAVLFVGQTV